MDLLTTGHSAFLTIDAGGTYLKSAIITGKGEVLDGSALTIKAYSEGSKEKIFSAFRETILKGLKFIDMNGMKIEGIGVAFPGPFDYVSGVPQMEHKFINIFGIKLRDFFRDIPGVPPDIPISFINDAHAVLLGELWKGNAIGYSNAAVVTMGTGLGFAFSKDGIVQCNSWGGPPVTIFRIPYNGGILEDFTGRRGFLKIYCAISGKNAEGIDVSDLGKWADEGDEYSITTFQMVGAILAEAINDILIEKEIQCLLLGGQISRSFHHMHKTLSEGLSDIDCLKRVSMVKSIDNAALFGAFKSFHIRV
jgi:glucokinase